MITNPKAKIAELYDEAQKLDPVADGERIKALFEESREIANKDQDPKLWAYIHAVFAKMIAPTNSALARMGYRTALEYFDPEEDREIWLECRGELGLAMMPLISSDPDLLEEVIEHMDFAFDQCPYLAPSLALLYGYRLRGDRRDNWERRMKCLDVSLSQVNKQADPDRWARHNNEIALAYPEEPYGDFAAQTEKRLKLHQASLEMVEATRGDTWIQTQIWMSECYLARVIGEPSENLDMAEECARAALSECSERTSTDTHRMALQAVAQSIFSARLGEPPIKHAEEALLLLDRAKTFVDPRLQPDGAADIERSRALTLLQLIRSGEPERIDELIASTQWAKALIGDRMPRATIVLCRIEGEARFEIGDFRGATEPFTEAVNVGHRILAESESIAGRLETIHNIGDAAGMLCFSHLENGETNEALIALERGKGLFWSDGNDGRTVEQIRTIVPRDGALLLACFAGPIGYVIVVTKSSMEAVRLPKLGHPRLMQLQRGGSHAKELGGWLYDYSMGLSDREHWNTAIKEMGRTLYVELWQPLLAKLEELQIQPGVELVWFHQGGSGLFPIHTAWTGDDSNPSWIVDRYALRYAPSLQALTISSKVESLASTLLIVSDPPEDLDTEELETVCIASVAESLGMNETVILRGQEATKKTVLKFLAQARTVHFSTHAVPDFQNPWNSHLYLAGEEKLTLLDCFSAIKLAAPRMISLSACDSGRTRVTSIADEFLGFPSAFLYAGTRTVYATLWRSDDWASALITRQFYLELAQGLQPAEALRRAQVWLRKVTNGELCAILKTIKTADGPDADTAAAMRSKLRNRPAKERMFAHPYYWGPFTITGH